MGNQKPENTSDKAAMLPTVLPGTWRNMGLGVAVSFATFGLSGILFPRHAAESAFGITSASETEPKTKTAGSSSKSAAELLSPLIGVRDLAIASTLAMLYRRGLGWEMGFVIVSRTVFCAADTVLITRQKGLREYGCPWLPLAVNAFFRTAVSLLLTLCEIGASLPASVCLSGLSLALGYCRLRKCHEMGCTHSLSSLLCWLPARSCFVG